MQENAHHEFNLLITSSQSGCYGGPNPQKLQYW